MYKRQAKASAATAESTAVKATRAAEEAERIAKQAEAKALVCVEINQCVGCTRQFFTKSFLGDDAAALKPSSNKEPASPRHRAGDASMAWRTTR